jgi:hypothetical protein
MNGTFMNGAQVLSIGIFFSLITIGLVSGLPTQLYHGLVAQGVPGATARHIANLPPIGALFAAFLGSNPMRTLIPAHVLHALGASKASYITGRTFFPNLVAPAFKTGLSYAFDFAAVASVIGAIASLSRGKRFVHGVSDVREEMGEGLFEVGDLAGAQMGLGVIPEGTTSSSTSQI